MDRKEAGMREEGASWQEKSLYLGLKMLTPRIDKGKRQARRDWAGLGSLRVYLQSFLKAKGHHCVCCAEQ